MAEALGDVSDDAVWRVMRKHDLHLDRRQSWCVSTDPEFSRKASEIVGLYLNPPENAIVLSVDEKPSIQALERAQGYIRLPNGRAVSNTFCRSGTATGLVKAGHYRRRRRRDFLDFMNGIIDSYGNAVHHNLERGVRADDENLRDAEDFERVLGRRLHIVLHGRTHRARWNRLRDSFPWFATGSARLKQQIRPYGVPNQYQFLLLRSAGVRVRARHYLPDEKKWADDPRLEEHNHAGVKNVVVPWHEVRRFVQSTASAISEAPSSWQAQSFGESGDRLPRKREDDFLSRVAEYCALRRSGAQVREVHQAEGGLAYIHVACREDGFALQFPVGATSECPEPCRPPPLRERSGSPLSSG